MDFDDFIDLKWLFRKRRRKPDLDVYAKLTAERGICKYRGLVSPWSHRPCRCEGWKYRRHYRGTIYCECGDAYHDHRFRAPRSDETPPPE